MSVFLKFDRSQWGQFLRLKKDQTIRFTGVIDDVDMYVSLKECKLLKVVD
jgi:hypothetical protein